MSAQDLFIEVYRQFYEQKEALSEAPSMTQSPEKSDFDFDIAEKELKDGMLEQGFFRNI